MDLLVAWRRTTAYPPAMETDAKALVTVGLRKTFDSTDDDQIPSEPSGGWTSRSIAASSSPSWALRAAASRRCSTWSPASTCRPTAHRGRRRTITGLSEDDLAMMRRRHIGIVFQFFNLLEGMTVLENVAMPAAVAGRSRKQAETRGRDLLDLLGIADKSSACTGRVVRRSASAPVDRPGPRERAHPAARRRAHRLARLRRGRRGARVVPPSP